MSTHRSYNWPQLFSEYEQSDLTQVEFCKQHNLNPKYFSLKLSKRKAQEGSAFAQVVIEPDRASPQELILELGHCKIHCPAAMTIPTVVSLVKSLA